MEVKKFSTPTCGQCKVVGMMLDKAGIKYEEIDCTMDVNKSLVEEHGINHVPVVIVDYNGHTERLNSIKDVKDWLVRK